MTETAEGKSELGWNPDCGNCRRNALLALDTALSRSDDLGAAVSISALLKDEATSATVLAVLQDAVSMLLEVIDSEDNEGAGEDGGGDHVTH